MPARAAVAAPPGATRLINAQLAGGSHNSERRWQMHVAAVGDGQCLGQAHARQYLDELLRISAGGRQVGNRVDTEKAMEARAAPFQLQRSWMTLTQQRLQAAARQMRLLTHFGGGGGGNI